MHITIIGSGYVGLVSGACLSEFGHDVICMDVDHVKIENLKQGVLPIYEPGLDGIVSKNTKANRLSFTNDIKEAVESATVIFVAVGTPPREDGSADLQYVISAAESIAQHMNSYKVIVNKSTVPVGTGEMTRQTVSRILAGRNVTCGFDVVSNPEFLREGAAINDFMYPDRIVIGCESPSARDIMTEIYRAPYENHHPFCFTDIVTAELIKYASNAFLATKITFMNEISRLCEAAGANVKQVAAAMGHDKRIGQSFLHAGPGYGGSCFPKDTRALSKIGRAHHVDMTIVDSVVAANEAQKLHMVDKIVGRMGDISGRCIAVLGLSFKPETDDMREAPSITIIQALLHRGAVIRAFDPIAMENAAKYAFTNDAITYCQDEYDACTGADALMLITEWNQFRSLNFEKLQNISNIQFFFDLRNVYEKHKIESLGIAYVGVGVS